MFNHQVELGLSTWLRMTWFPLNFVCPDVQLVSRDCLELDSSFPAGDKYKYGIYCPVAPWDWTTMRSRYIKIVPSFRGHTDPY